MMSGTFRRRFLERKLRPIRESKYRTGIYRVGYDTFWDVFEDHFLS
jgi:hypothetical protein